MFPFQASAQKLLAPVLTNIMRHVDPSVPVDASSAGQVATELEVFAAGLRFMECRGSTGTTEHPVVGLVRAAWTAFGQVSKRFVVAFGIVLFALRGEARMTSSYLSVCVWCMVCVCVWGGGGVDCGGLSACSFRFGANAKVASGLCSCFSAALVSAQLSVGPLLSDMCQLVVPMFITHGHVACLNFLGSAVQVFGPTATTESAKVLHSLLDNVSTAVFSVLQQKLREKKLRDAAPLLLGFWELVHLYVAVAVP